MPKIQKKHTIVAYLQYRNQFPNGQFRGKANDAIQQLEEIAAWHQGLKSNRLSAYLKYIDEFPDGIHRADADEKIAQLQADVTTKKKEIPIGTGASPLQKKQERVTTSGLEKQESNKKGAIRWGLLVLLIPFLFFGISRFINPSTPTLEKEESVTSSETSVDKILPDNEISKEDTHKTELEEVKRNYDDLVTKGDAEMRKSKPDYNLVVKHYEQAAKIAVELRIDPTKLKKGILNARNEIRKLQEAAKTSVNSGTFKDTRDGQTYKWVRLKDGKKWMAQNLNYKRTDSWCYKDKDSNCQKYGRLYTWSAAKEACPKGWRLPSDDEWWEMTSQYGKAHSSLKGNSEVNTGKTAYKTLIKKGSSGFSAMLGGFGNPSSGSSGYVMLNEHGNYWSSTENETHNSSAWFYDFYSSILKVVRTYDYKHRSRSCRCVQD